MRNLPALILGGCLSFAGTTTWAQFSTNSTNIEFGTGIKQTRVPDDHAAATGYWHPTATFTAFVVDVPAKGKLTAALDHKDMGAMFICSYSKAQFNNITRGNATLRRTITRTSTYTNDSKETVQAYFVVSDVEHRSTKAEPYTVTFTRSWATPEAPPIPGAPAPNAPAAEAPVPKS